MKSGEKFAEDVLNGKTVPFSFRLGKEKARLKQIRSSRATEKDREVSEHVYSCLENSLTVRTKCTCIPPSGMLTFRVSLRAEKNIGKRIHDVAILDFSEKSGRDSISLRGFNGAANWLNKDGEYPLYNFRIRDREMVSGTKWDYTESEGGAALTYLPVWLLHGKKNGLWFGPEWGGCWRLKVQNKKGAVRTRLYLPFLDFVMWQGEEFDLPPVTMGVYDGDVWDGCLAMRGCIRDEIMPKPGGKIPEPQLVYQILGGPAVRLAGKDLEKDVEKARRIGMEAYIWASSWCRRLKPRTMFPEKLKKYHPHICRKGEPDTWGNWWERNGDYAPDKARYPEGLAAFSDKLAEKGMRLGLWYDPRVNVRADEYRKLQGEDVLLPFTRKHPRDRMWDMGLINLGSSAGREYMFELLESFIKDYNCDWLWHDLNVELRERYFDACEEKGRGGLLELAYHNGINEVYDRLLKKYPDLVIEWCGSGGNLMNLGIFRRSHIHWVTDHESVDRGKDGECLCYSARNFRSVLNWIFPASMIMNTFKPSAEDVSKDGIGPRNFAPHMGSSFGIAHYLLDWNEDNMAKAEEAGRVFREIRGYLNQDFYGLYKPPRQLDEWDGWQFHDPQKNEGVLFIFRGEKCDMDSDSVRPRWIDARNTEFSCIFGNAEIKVETRKKLSILLDGSAAVVKYKEKKQE